MVFYHPWGLLALLTIPSILGLHFFRSRRQVRRVGGLHLWEFAPTRLPIGGRFQKIVPAASLFAQLLAALVLSLLVAGIDFPHESRQRHFTLIVDDSLSMRAASPETAAERARQFIETWTREGDRFTLVAAGDRARLLAEPFAARADLLAALASWSPEAPSTDLLAGLALATKFTTADQKVLLLTDDPRSATGLMDAIEAEGVGRAIVNSAIEFAERVRAAPDRDRVLLRLRRYAKTAAPTAVQASIDGVNVFSQSVDLEPGKATMLTFELAELHRPLTITLANDALPADNTAVLAPVVIKPVYVAAIGLDEISRFLARAVDAVEYAGMTENAAEAQLVFVRDSTASAPSVCLFNAIPGATDLALAEGRDLLVDRRADVTRRLPLEGVLWSYQASAMPPAGSRLLVQHRGVPLLSVEGAVYRLNLATDRTNLFRQTAWPILVQGLVEACRERLPGLSRGNFRAGETVALNLPEELGPAVLYRHGIEMARYETPPSALADLSAGYYELNAGGNVVAAFAVNVFASEESDLSRMAAEKADLSLLVPAALRQSETDRRLFFGLMLLLTALVGLSWIFQDLSR